ncbi:uncharacterized protein LOC127243126 [Andrographis paniculata]|uniref:uncharacterized protein LOC127243126 n=1 Tax=Andrographis paniculata TaxID=175694 RepID=UPI0021E8EB5B|nr:uncharacterized protein LOC127243126 [Andrographis paniculata]
MDVDANGGNISSLRISTVDEEDEEDEIQHDKVKDEVSEEEDEEEDGALVTLGFVEKPKTPWSLHRQYFPSKAGGTPAWLDPKNLPSGKSIHCDFCEEPLQFVLQVYVPLGEESTFHRTLYLFMCPSMACLLRDQHEQWKRQPEIPSRSVKVFRCQLPRVNPFYSSVAPPEDGTAQPLMDGAPLCDWCGTWKGDKLCGSCKRARYCSGKHQAAHWRSSSSSHKISCQQVKTSDEEAASARFDNRQTAASNTLFPEYVIIDEDECEDDEEKSNDTGSSSSLISRSHTDSSYGKWMSYFEGHNDNKSWASFQERISRAPDQILRLNCRDSSSGPAKPLWPVSSGRPSRLDIPKCSYCDSTRVFELQVLPQLLYFFHVEDTEDSLDWATIVIYTCEASCHGGAAYIEEFAWVQLASQSIPNQ